MGAGGRMSVPPEKKKSDCKALRRVPFSKPPFTLGEIKKSIPPHCFKRSIPHSFSYVVYDLTIASLLYYIATTYINLLPHPLPYLVWPIYYCVQGCVLIGVWVIAHECGHHAFSDHQWLDDTVGLVLHSSLLVPYFSWKYSHRRHHSNTGSIDRDEVFVPKTKSQIGWYSKYLNNPPGRLLTVIITLTLGWPLYLMFNVSGRPYDRFACHYDPYGPIYSDRERLQIYLSNAGVIAVTYGLYRLAAIKGLVWVLNVYGGPLLVVNGFLVLITWLQHTHPALPHYNSSEWDWLRGALATVDRDYGVLNKVFDVILIALTKCSSQVLISPNTKMRVKWFKVSNDEYHRVDWADYKMIEVKANSKTNSKSHMSPNNVQDLVNQIGAIKEAIKELKFVAIKVDTSRGLSYQEINASLLKFNAFGGLKVYY